MARRKRGWIDNACYHITHRCHNRKFLFRYKKYRKFYLRHLFEMQKRYNIVKKVNSGLLTCGDCFKSLAYPTLKVSENGIR